MINTVGIGSAEGAMISDPETNDYKRDNAGNPVITKLNEAELRSYC
jgi:Ca-activated chloride channel family protein